MTPRDPLPAWPAASVPPVHGKTSRGVADTVPVFKLYGEERWPSLDMVHCESIAARSALHDWHIKPHRHHGLFQIFCLRGGVATAQVDGHRQPLVPGSILLVPQMCIHGFEFGHDADGQVLTVAYPLLARIDPTVASCLVGLDGAWLLTPSAVERERFDHMLAALVDTYVKAGAQRQVMLDALLIALLGWLAEALLAQQGGPAGGGAPPRRFPRGRSARHFTEFCQLVEARFAQQLPIAAYARALGITGAHLNVVCRAAVGRSALELVHERLLLEARRNLLYTTMTVSVLADTLGFVDPAYFTRFFKRATGLSPTAFRAQAHSLLSQGAARAPARASGSTKSG